MRVMMDLERPPADVGDEAPVIGDDAFPRIPLVLVIDDTQSVRIVMRGMLEALGCSVITAQDGREGFDAFRVYRPDLVITDLIMPEQEGIETIRLIRREQPDARIVAMSVGGRSGGLGLLEMAHKLGADATLTKPFTREALIDVVRALLPTDRV